MATRRRKKPSTQDEATDETLARPLRVSQPEKLTENALLEAALRYLDRQDGSVSHVRKILHRRVFRYSDEDTKEQALHAIEVVLQRLVDSRVLDDQRYCLALAESQRRRGASLLKIRQKLIARGLTSENIDSAMESINADEELSEEASCAIYARKRRLTQRYDLSDPKERNKALAALARQGFSFEVARSTLGL